MYPVLAPTISLRLALIATANQAMKTPARIA
jgi:hypothetical protein